MVIDREYAPTTLATSCIELFRYIEMTEYFISGLVSKQIEKLGAESTTTVPHICIMLGGITSQPNITRHWIISPNRYDARLEEEGIEWVLRHLFLDLPLYTCPNDPVLKPIDGGASYSFITENEQRTLYIQYASKLSIRDVNGENLKITDV